MEHIFALNSLIENARANNPLIFITLLDLKNAFGSVPHPLIMDMLNHVHLPPEFTSYVSDCYSKLEVRMSTDKWKTNHFKIKRGIFQGDTLSPLLFLLAFQPVIQLAESLETEGFQLRLFAPDSEGLPPPDAHVYVLWDEEDSDEPQGWYLCRVLEYYHNGTSKVEYLISSETELLDLKSTPWHLPENQPKDSSRPQ